MAMRKSATKKYNWVALPDKGWEFAPDTPEIRRDIVASHPWSTDILVLASMKGIRTKQWIEQSVTPGTEFGDDQPKALMRTRSGVREWTCPWECYQILIRRRLQVAATVVKRNSWKLHGSPSGSIRWDHKVGAWSLDNKYNQAWFESNQLGEMAPPISQTWRVKCGNKHRYHEQKVDTENCTALATKPAPSTVTTSTTTATEANPNSNERSYINSSIDTVAKYVDLGDVPGWIQAVCAVVGLFFSGGVVIQIYTHVVGATPWYVKLPYRCCPERVGNFSCCFGLISFQKYFCVCRARGEGRYHRALKDDMNCGTDHCRTCLMQIDAERHELLDATGG